jgi:hypothetical protein
MSKNKKKSVFETIDPLGNPIFLSTSTWENHIIKNHPEMAGEEKQVKKTIEDPDDIFEDSNFSTTCNYYRKQEGTRLNLFGDYVKVSVDSVIGRIKTAYTLSNYGNEGKQKYTK